MVLEVVLSGIAAAFAIVGGLYGAYALLQRRIATRPYKRSLSIFAGTNELRDNLLKLNGRTANFDTVLDFSIGDGFSNRIVTETEY